jgi:hypothetical protein
LATKLCYGYLRLERKGPQGVGMLFVSPVFQLGQPMLYLPKSAILFFVIILGSLVHYRQLGYNLFKVLIHSLQLGV